MKDKNSEFRLFREHLPRKNKLAMLGLIISDADRADSDFCKCAGTL